MSWRSGSELFCEMWPLIQARIRDKQRRREFTAGLLRHLIEHDVDPEDVADVHPEVRAALAAAGVEALPGGDDDDPDEAVAGCVRQLGHADAGARATAAEAVRHFVPQAREPGKAAAVALPALVGVLGDAAPKVRRQAAMSIRVLIRDGHPIPRQVSASLRAATRHGDRIVAQRVQEALSAAGG